jgi:hypothetical protein
MSCQNFGRFKESYYILYSKCDTNILNHSIKFVATIEVLYLTMGSLSIATIDIILIYKD